MALNPIVALEIGTTRTVVLVGDSLDGRGGDVKIIGRGIVPTAGVRKGVVTGVHQARACVEAAVAEAAAESNIRIGLAHLAVSGGHISSDTMACPTVVDSPDSRVGREDMDAALEAMNAAGVADDRQILHRIPQFYTLDGKAGIPNPEGMHGRNLSVGALVVHGRRNHLDDAVAVARAADLDVRDAVFAGICAAKAALTPEHRRGGALLVHLGGGVTDCVCFVDGAPVLAASLPIGGDHVTHDIQHAFGLTTGAQAEDLKIRHGSAVLDPAAPRERVKIQLGQGFGERAVPPRALHTVMNARLNELLGFVRQLVDERDCLPRLAAGVVLTGGVAYTPGMAELASRVFGARCAIGGIHGVKGLEDAPEPARLAAAAGLVLLGFESSPAPETLLDRLGRAIRRHLPWTQH
ncbi:MAG: cell division protein FtsA [Kiritimatiellaeota bacterium]|nr:cell division protein FtsA [Kiritimatiellota bacterium]